MKKHTSQNTIMKYGLLKSFFESSKMIETVLYSGHKSALPTKVVDLFARYKNLYQLGIVKHIQVRLQFLTARVSNLGKRLPG
jgi:hypothetical protein